MYFCTVKQTPISTPKNWPPTWFGEGVFSNTFLQKTPSVGFRFTSMDQGLSHYYHPFTFTGKERDEETGYGYFGARYMDHELMTMWLSVDPMADKYPNISPYAYCAWNPVKLVDPDGRDVVLSESAQKIHEKYYRKQGYEKYTELYDKLNDDHSIQINVKECNDNAYAKSIGANGVVDYSAIQQDKFSNGCFDIEWGDPNDMHGGTNEHVFLEEFFHAGQMKDANYDLSATYSINKEYDAKLFAVRMSTESYDMTFDDTKNWFFGIPTEMHIINTYEPSTAKDYLQFGINVTVRDRFNGVYNGYKIGGHYNEFPRN